MLMIEIKRCRYCNNKIREKAYYCDQCGRILNSKIEITINHEFEKILDYLITNLKKTNDGFEYTPLIENYVILFWNYMDRYSKLKDVAKNDKITLYSWEKSFPLNTAYELKNKPKSSRNKYFIFILNREYDEYKNSLNKTEFEFIYFTNIDNRKIDNLFDETLKLFNLKIFEFECIERYLMNKSNKELNLDENYKNEVIISHKSNGKDLDYQYGLSFDDIYGFLGFLTLINNYNKTTKILSNNFQDRYKLIDFNILLKVVRVNNEFIEHYDYLSYRLEHLDLSFSKEKISIKEIFIEKFKNKHISKELKIYLSLYHLASIEDDLSSSFLKYWSLSERIIKDSMGEDIKNEKLIKLMKNILIITGYPESVYEQIKYVEKKRNEYVHEFKFDIIEQSDRNLAKSISEKILGYLILSNIKIKKLKDFGYILEYYNRDDEIKKINMILDDFNSK
ncbi:hypothetical protein PXD04_11280 (plasmid) [Methanosphaera sp. ISO3-F5]|uniref:hypothetical protein n=1 Tax=Methanosphaera sp. ISO3-F5 TaxID=1452353 RepID=UPI002B25E156|nr:hypothetical protein [Methanosphaera sp. ISO3-F5]WQH65456.1 hypothetical protein PXD04_11280 [Methanosphaera sp. ISO3-F5]